ncbi:hypothetical protein HUG17_10453 [Dermatophagoides farinae]|uniref:Transmembrane protein 198 n=1 Tax=Dermatophagoides farinae TaxID=6954 RepID=A0A9D4NQR2_DERFA|nr:hypothetical protein HUG17_10453 [Dermatophagoides farinae]
MANKSTTKLLNSSIESIINNQNFQKTANTDQQQSIHSSITVLNDELSINQTANAFATASDSKTSPFSDQINNLFQYMKDLLFPTITSNDHGSSAENNNDDDEDFGDYFNLASSGFGNNNNLDYDDEMILFNTTAEKTILNDFDDSQITFENLTSSINLNSTSSSSSSIATIMPTIIPRYNSHKMIRTSHGIRPNLDSTTTTIDTFVNVDHQNHHNQDNGNDDDVFKSQSSSIENIFLTSPTTTTTIASNLTIDEYQRPNFFHTSTTDISVENIQTDDTLMNNIFSFAGDSQCFHSPDDYELITSMLFFFVGFLLGAILFHTICTAENISITIPVLIPQHGNLIAALFAGLIIGSITMLVAYFGLFIIGINFGLMLAIGLLIVIYLLRPYYIPLQAPLSSLTLLIFFVALSLVGSLTTVYFSKGGTIMASSMYGSALTLLCIDYFLEDFKVIHWFLDHLSSNSGSSNNSSSIAIDVNNNNGGDFIHSSINPTNDWYGLLTGIKRSQKLCPGSFIILLLWPILTLFGMIIQSCCTARHYKYGNGGYGMVDNTSGRGTPPSLLNNSRESIRSLNHYHHYSYPNKSAKLYHQSTNSVRSQQNDRSLTKNSLNLDEQRLEQRHRKYRYLYQVRTAHGDVISQQQQQLCLPDQDSFTFNSDLSSHFFPSESRTTTLSVA